jgi:hypothetical protein
MTSTTGMIVRQTFEIRCLSLSHHLPDRQRTIGLGLLLDALRRETAGPMLGQKVVLSTLCWRHPLAEWRKSDENGAMNGWRKKSHSGAIANPPGSAWISLDQRRNTRQAAIVQSVTQSTPF